MASDRKELADRLEKLVAPRNGHSLGGLEVVSLADTFFSHLPTILDALRDRGAERMREEVNLTGSEAEFVAEMRHDDPPAEEPWRNFDPDFRQKDIERLIRKGWFEKRTRGEYREYRWTAAGRKALPARAAQQEGRSDG